MPEPRSAQPFQHGCRRASVGDTEVSTTNNCERTDANQWRSCLLVHARYKMFRFINDAIFWKPFDLVSRDAEIFTLNQHCTLLSPHQLSRILLTQGCRRLDSVSLRSSRKEESFSGSPPTFPPPYTLRLTSKAKSGRWNCYEASASSFII